VKPEKMCQSRNCVFVGELIFEEVIVFQLVAKIRSLSEEAPPQLFTFN
jgi:hypothetical protein